MNKTILGKTLILNLSSSILVALFILSSFSSIGRDSDTLRVAEPNRPHVSYTIIVNKLFENKNYKIEMQTNSSLHQLLITGGSDQKKMYRFYLFDIDGKLKSRAMIRSNEKTAFVNIAKGNYFFEIFNDDERIENGQLTVK